MPVTYVFHSLSDLADFFDECAQRAADTAEHSDTKRIKDLNTREWTTWRAAADTVRNARIEPTEESTP